MKEVVQLITEPLNEIGLKVDSVEMINEGTNKFLRITIDRDTPVDLDACVDATHIINKLLDDADPIKEKYTLEVCSKQKGGA